MSPEPGCLSTLLDERGAAVWDDMGVKGGTNMARDLLNGVPTYLHIYWWTFADGERRNRKVEDSLDSINIGSFSDHVVIQICCLYTTTDLRSNLYLFPLILWVSPTSVNLFSRYFTFHKASAKNLMIFFFKACVILLSVCNCTKDTIYLPLLCFANQTPQPWD